MIVVFSYFYMQHQHTDEYIYYIEGNYAGDPLPIQEIKKSKNIFCSDCNMMVKKLRNSAQIVTKDGTTYFFNDVSCMIRWLDKAEHQDSMKFAFVYVPECTCYMDARGAWYVRDGLTPLGYGVTAFGTYMEAQRSDMLLSAEDFGDENFARDTSKRKKVYDFSEVSMFVLRGETLLNPVARKIIFMEVENE